MLSLFWGITILLEGVQAYALDLPVHSLPHDNVDEDGSLYFLQRAAFFKVDKSKTENNASMKLLEVATNSTMCYAHLGCFEFKANSAPQISMLEQSRETRVQQTQELAFDEFSAVVPQELQMQLEALRHFDLFPQRTDRCLIPRGNLALLSTADFPSGASSQASIFSAEPVAPDAQLSAFGFLLGEAQKRIFFFLSTTHAHAIAWFVIGSWAVLWGLVILRRLLSVFLLLERAKVKHHHTNEERPEASAWSRGFWHWVTVSWVTEWVRRFGTSVFKGEVSMKAEDFGKLGFEEDESWNCYSKFLELWSQESLRKGGERHASLWCVLFRFVGLWNWIKMLIFTAVHMALSYVVSVYLIEVAINHVVAMQRHSFAIWSHGQLIPVFLTLGGFWGIPVFRMVVNTLQTMLDGRLSLQMVQALRLAVYRKAQRLPTKSVSEEGTPADKKGEDSEKDANLVNLVSCDVGITTDGSSKFLAEAALMPLMISWLMYVASRKLHRAILLGFCGIVPLWAILFGLSCLQVRMSTLRLTCVHERLQKTQDVLDGIRTVKSYAWDESAQEEITAIRNNELKYLWRFWMNVGAFMQIAILLSHVFVVCTLMGHIWLYGGISAPSIFVCLQILNNLKAMLESLKDKFSKFLLIFPSMRRLEQFLALVEAPNCDRMKHLETASTPHYISPGSGVIHLKGSFAWTRDGQSMLHDLDITVRPGELVGVVGAVGSGKSALLHAMLGELWPSGDAQVSCLATIAYSAQSPWIFEGTLQENVLYGTEYSEKEYKEVLAAAALHRDVDVLPGGDDVRIGSRGITLSGGQRARISLARAAYRQDSDITLLDDPFGSVDAPTARHLLEHLIRGPMLRNRTRIVCLQPEVDRISAFDRLLVLEQGRVVFDGPPVQAVATDAFRKLSVQNLADVSTTSCAGMPLCPVEMPELTQKVRSVQTMTAAQGQLLRAPEYQSRASWETVKLYCSRGGWSRLVLNLLCSFVHIACFQMASVTIAWWSNHPKGNRAHIGYKYIMIYGLWVLLAGFVFMFLWYFGTSFSWHVSKYVHEEAVNSVLRAPIDKFFDKHPTSRVLTRLSDDLSSLDMKMFSAFAQVLGSIFSFMVPLIFIHVVMPGYFVFVSIPLYVSILAIVTRYWKVMVPLRHLVALSGSVANGHLHEVRNRNVSVRAYKATERMAAAAIEDFDKLSVAKFASDTCMKIWIDNTLEMSFCVQVTLLGLIAVLRPSWVGPGTIGLCLVNSFQIQNGIAGWVNICSAAQFEFISLHRIWELMPPNLPQEAPQTKPGDEARSGLVVDVARTELSNLVMAQAGDRLQVVFEGSGKALFEQSRNGQALCLAPEASLSDLAPGCWDLQGSGQVRLVSINGAFCDASALAAGLCSPSDESMLRLEFQGEWMADGAEVQIQDLRACYGDCGPDILKGVSLGVGVGQRVAITGGSGSGKSTLLLALLRMLEPTGGRVLINGVDTRDVGLCALRTNIGFVPQDPVLFSGTIRHNLDPYGWYSEERIWQALRWVAFADIVEGLPEQLDFLIYDAGSNLSFGQRQLICLARMVLRRPALLLLDEATSAIDPKTQQIVKQAIRSAFHGSTILAVAHRLETILDFDAVVVLDNGVVVEHGPVQQLTQTKNGVFAKMLSAKQHW